MRNLIAAFLFSTVAACVGEAQVSGTATVDTPDLVEVEPGVQVVADYDEPVFYSGGYYWRQDGDAWYRSDNYASGFVYAEPPSVIVGIHDTHRYVHYRPNGYVARHRPTRRVEPVRRETRTQPVRVEGRTHEEHHEEHHDDKHDHDHDHH